MFGAYQDCKQQQAITMLFGTQHGKGKRKRRHRAATAEIAQETDAAVTGLEPDEDHAVDALSLAKSRSCSAQISPSLRPY